MAVLRGSIKYTILRPQQTCTHSPPHPLLPTDFTAARPQAHHALSTDGALSTTMRGKLEEVPPRPYLYESTRIFSDWVMDEGFWRLQWAAGLRETWQTTASAAQSQRNTNPHDRCVSSRDHCGLRQCKTLQKKGSLTLWVVLYNCSSRQMGKYTVWLDCIL